MQELVVIRDKRMEGVLLCSRVRWIVDGKKLQNTFVDSRNVII